MIIIFCCKDYTNSILVRIMPFAKPRLPNINHHCKDMIEECEEDDRLHLHQIEALHELCNWFDTPTANNDIALVCMPTGSGKTGIIACLPYYLASINRGGGQPRYLFNKPILVVAPSLAIQEQLADELAHFTQGRTPFLKRINVVPLERYDILPKALKIDNTDQIKNPDFLKSYELIITNAQKFVGNDWPDHLDNNLFRLLIVDEAHHHPAATWKRIVDKFRNTECPVVFFTATPFRTDGQRVLGQQESGIAYHFSIDDAVERRIIRRSKFQEIDEVGALLFRKPEDHTEEQRQDAYKWVAILTKVKELLEYKRSAFPDAPHMAIVKCKDTSNSKLLLEIWEKSYPDEKAKCLNSLELEHKRAKVKKSIEANELSLVIIVDMLLEGFDHPPISIAAITHRIRSHVRFVQFVGRAQRIYRKQGYDEPNELCADIITHKDYKQRLNYKNFANEAFQIGNV